MSKFSNKTFYTISWERAKNPERPEILKGNQFIGFDSLLKAIYACNTCNFAVNYNLTVYKFDLDKNCKIKKETYKDYNMDWYPFCRYRFDGEMVLNCLGIINIYDIDLRKSIEWESPKTGTTHVFPYFKYRWIRQFDKNFDYSSIINFDSEGELIKTFLK